MVVFFIHWQLLCWFFFLLLCFTGDIFQGLIRFQSLIHTHSVLEVSSIWLSGLFKWFTKLYFQFFFQTSNPYSQLSDEYFQLNVLWFLQIQQFLKSNLFSHHYAGISFQFGKLRVILEHPIIHFDCSGPSRYPNRLLCLCSFFILPNPNPFCLVLPFYFLAQKSSRVARCLKIKSKVFDLTFRGLYEFGQNSISNPSHHYCQHKLSAPVQIVYCC